MEDVVAAGHGGAQRIVVEDVAVAAFDIEVVNRLRQTRGPDHDADVVSALDQGSGDVQAGTRLHDHELLLSGHGANLAGGAWTVARRLGKLCRS